MAISTFGQTRRYQRACTKSESEPHFGADPQFISLEDRTGPQFGTIPGLVGSLATIWFRFVPRDVACYAAKTPYYAPILKTWAVSSAVERLVYTERVHPT